MARTVPSGLAVADSDSRQIRVERRESRHVEHGVMNDVGAVAVPDDQVVVGVVEDQSAAARDRIGEHYRDVGAGTGQGPQNIVDNAFVIEAASG